MKSRYIRNEHHLSDEKYSPTCLSGHQFYFEKLYQIATTLQSMFFLFSLISIKNVIQTSHDVLLEHLYLALI